MASVRTATTRPTRRWIFPLSLVTAVAMLVGWFPWSSLLTQQRQIDSASAQIAAVTQQQRNLTAQSKSVDTKAAAVALAREQYQLVNPGQSLIQVLPGNANGNVSASSVDPGLQPLVSPNQYSPLLPVSASVPASPSFHLRGFLARLVRTFEFWR